MKANRDCHFGRILLIGVFLVALSFSASAGVQKRIVVNLRRQTLSRFEADAEAKVVDCVTGRAGKETTPGEFAIASKEKDYVSKTYKVDMPYSMFFTPDKKAIHFTEFAKLRSLARYLGLDSPGSHGCVGVDMDDAKALFDWTDVGTPIIVIEGTLDGTWSARDDSREFVLAIDGDVVKLTEVRGTAGRLTRNARLKRTGASETFRIERANDEAVLQLLGFADAALRQAIIDHHPDPSYLVVTRDAAADGTESVKGEWHGVVVKKAPDGKFKELVQPKDAPAKAYVFAH